jgi:SAM-dependent methyltransferase
MESIASEWVSESRFGKWFQGTDTWYRYVLCEALADLKKLAGPDLPPLPKMLDVGCGQGMAFDLLHEHFGAAEIVGVDIDPIMVRMARETAARSQAAVTVTGDSVMRLNLPDNSMDGVLCHQLVHHCADQLGALREMLRVLKPGGYFFLSESCEAFINTWTVRWFFTHPPGVQKPAEGYLRLARQAGFKYDDTRDVRTSTPWWSLPDLGIKRRLGWEKTPSPVTELLLVARK